VVILKLFHQYGDPEDDKVEDIIVGVDVPRHLQNLHIVVKPECRWCSCGTWQDCMIPCRHAMAVYSQVSQRKRLGIYAVRACG